MWFLIMLVTVAGCGRHGFDAVSTGTDAAGTDAAGTDAMGPIDAADAAVQPACMVALEAGDAAACVVKGDGTVWCWGSNGGEFGIDPAVLGSSAVPVQVPGVSDVVEIGLSIGRYACARHANGTVSCWGRNLNLLADSTCCSDFIPPTQVPGVEEVKHLAVGEYSICAIKLDGTVWCWGADNGSVGMLGARAGGIQNLWTDGVQPVADLADRAVSIAAGYGFTCVLENDASLWCWGANDSYQLGDEVISASAIPLRIDLDDVTHVDLGAGSGHACAVKLDRSMWCWGSGGRGELGNGLFLYTGTPVSVSSFVTSDPPVISAGTEQTCARRDDDTLACWGFNGAFSPLGIGTAGMHHATPQTLTTLTVPALEVSTGWTTKCARFADDTIACWGGQSQLEPTALPFACP